MHLITAPVTPGAGSDETGASGVPHHTGTRTPAVDTAALDAAGAGLPVDPDDARSRAEFADAARRVPGAYGASVTGPAGTGLT